MRVLLVSCNGADRTLGGAERYVAELLTGLEHQGHHAEVLSAFPVHDVSAARTRVLHHSDWRSSQSRRVRNHLADWAAIPSRRYDSLLREISPDVVHTNNLPGISTGIWESARRNGLPVVHTLHDYHLLCPRTTLMRRDLTPCEPSPLLCGLRTRRLARWSSGVQTVIGVSSFMIERHTHLFSDRVARRVIQPPLSPLPGSHGGAPPPRLRVLGFLGTLAKTKGVGTLVEVAPQLAKRGIRLRVAGDGPMRREVESAPGLEYAGHLSGPALARFLTECDAGVVPSLWDEPAGLVACEWQAAARPLIATGRAGLLDAAARGGALLFDGSAAGLLEAVDRLADEREWVTLTETLPEVSGNDDLERWLSAHLEAYETALRGSVSSPR